MGVKAVNHVEIPCESRSQLGQIRGTSATDDQNVDLILEALKLGGTENRNARESFYRIGRTAGKDSHQLRILVLSSRQFNAAT